MGNQNTPERDEQICQLCYGKHFTQGIDYDQEEENDERSQSQRKKGLEQSEIQKRSFSSASDYALDISSKMQISFDNHQSNSNNTKLLQYNELLELNDFVTQDDELKYFQKFEFGYLKYSEEFEKYRLYQYFQQRQIEKYLNEEYDEQLKVSKKYEQKYLDKVINAQYNLNKCGKEVALLALKQQFEHVGVQLLFTHEQGALHKENQNILKSEKKEMYEDKQAQIQEEYKEKLRHLAKTGFLPENYYSLQLIDTDEWYYQRAIENKREFAKYFKKKLLSHFREFQKGVKAKKEDILILGLRKGSIIVDFVFNNFYKPTKECFSCLGNWFSGIEENPIVNVLQISEDQFDERWNMHWKSSQSDIYRGNINGKRQAYQLPVGYHGIGLKVIGEYPDDEWIKEDVSDNTWIVLFHKTEIQWVKSIMKEGLKPGSVQRYQKNSCRFGRGKVGKGVYFSDNIKECCMYGVNAQIGSRQFEFIFQCRINPKTVKSPKKNQAYYVVNNMKDIRPYRLLLKDIH